MLTPSVPRLIFGASICFLLAASAHAQRQHVLGLIGEPPDTSNWPHPAAPDGNPFPRSTATAAEIAQRDLTAQLGKVLFWDEQVSSDNTMSCGTCHPPAAGGTDDRLGALHANGNFGTFGVIPQAINALNGRVDYGFLVPPSSSIVREITGVQAPTMIGAYVFDRLFWDRRAGPEFQDEAMVTIPNFDDWAACEDLAVEPPLSDVEMGHENETWASNFIQKKLGSSFPLALVDPATIPADVLFLVTANATYARIFNKVFFNDPQFGGPLGVTRERFAMAVAHYMRTLIPDQAPIDLGTMTASQIAGMNLMKPPRANCFACHSVSGNPTIDPVTGQLANAFDNPLSDGLFHQIGLGGTPPQPARKTPTLRNIGLHNKFFSTGHGGDGVTKIFVTNFDELITFYDNQPGFTGFNGTLTLAERAQVRDFLENALTDPRVAAETFPFDRPELASERPDFNPFEGNEFGNGTPGPSGLTPEIIANAPPLVPGPAVSAAQPSWFKVGVGNSPANRPAVLLVSGSAGSGPVVWVGPPISSVPAQNTNGQGISTIHRPFPLTASAIGVPVFVQWVLDDNGVRAFSDAARFVPFQF